MDLISAEHGQTLQLFIAEEVRPPSGIYLPDLIQKISERYAFAVGPPNYETILREGAKYKEGRFIAQGRTIAIKDLGFFNDGILVDVSSNTDDSEIVLNDLIIWAIQSFGFREPQTKLPRRFFSSLIVDFDVELGRALASFEQLRQAFALAISEKYDIYPEVNASRIALSADQTKLPPQTTFDFIIERRVGRAFEENRYFSTAPFPTASHLDLLELFERQLLGKGQ